MTKEEIEIVVKAAREFPPGRARYWRYDGHD
jgi:hypothetical protein